MRFWDAVSRIILRGRIFVILLLVIATYFLTTQWKYAHFSHTEANLLPEDHPINIQYDNFFKFFGEEGNLILLAVKDSTVFQHEKFNNWNALSEKLRKFDEVTYAISLSDIKELKKDNENKKFIVEPLFKKPPQSDEEIIKIKEELFNKLPFFENLLFNKETGTLQTLVYLKKDIVNTPIRKLFVLNDFNPIIEKFEKENNIDVVVSGMPYIRTMNSNNIKDEMKMFLGLALFVTALIFFLFFRSFRATFITMIVVSIGVMWAFGFIGLFRYEISILTALIPPLIIVIGVPNAIFLINKYQQEVKKHGGKARSLTRVISKIGNATLMTNITTAAGFATFIFTRSQLLSEFGVIASISILAIFLLSLLIIPIVYSYMPLPKEKHLKHLQKKWVKKATNWLEKTVKNRRIEIYITTVIILIISMIGVNFIHVSGSLIEDMPKDKQFTKDIRFIEKEFGGVLALEFLIDTKKPKGALKLSTLKRMEKLNEIIDEIPELSKTISVLNAVKYTKQAFYNNNPEYYQLPTKEEQVFIMPYVKNSSSHSKNLLSTYVDSTGQYTRMTTYMKDIGTEKMERIEERINARVNKVFPKKKYEVTMTGKALVFLKGTNYLINNLIVSLGLAVLLISIFMGWMFRDFKMIVISLIPNVLPLLLTAGVMGYLGIPLKPSTILVFSVAFGISVDDTIHFLAKYRQELVANNWIAKKSIYAAIRETGVSMFYTSIVLFFGFLVFTVSSFGGTIALGGLVSGTLLVAMLSNLLLLPSLLLSLESKISNKEIFKERSLDVLPKDE
jgi:predicted RND superfamily exporter protein